MRTSSYVDFSVPMGELDDNLPTVSNVITSFVMVDQAGTTTENNSDTTGGDSAAAAEPCLISVATANTAQLRVGPGENRAVIAFLPEKREFLALGRFVTDDNAVWYKLDKNEVAPKSSANELWVAAEQVDAEGGCETIEDASAPPVIPIAPGGNSGGGNAGGADGDGSDDSGGTGGDSVAGIIPRAGTWIWTLDATTYASCEGTGTISVNSTDVYFFLTYTAVISVPGDGTTMNFDGDTFIQTSPSNYLGDYNFGSTNAQIYLLVESPTRMTGRIVGNWTISGVGCSATTYHTLTFRG